MLNDAPRKQLAILIEEHGVKVAHDARLCEALLRDYCGEYRLEIAALTASVKWGIPKSLNEVGQMPPATLRANLSRRLQENHGLAEESAFWAVDSWASVLGIPLGGDLPPATGRPREESGETWSMPLPPTSPPLVQSPPPPKPQLPPLPVVQSPPPPPPPQVQSPVWRPPSPPLPQNRTPFPAVQSPSPNPSWQPPSPAPRPPSQPQLPPLPLAQSPLPKPPSQPQLPPLPQVQSPVPPAPQSPMMMPLLVAARSFENGQISPQLQQVQGYLKTQLKLRKPDTLVEEMRLAGVQPFTATQLVKGAQRSGALMQFWIALGIFATLLAVYRNSLLLIAALVYLVVRGIQLAATF